MKRVIFGVVCVVSIMLAGCDLGDSTDARSVAEAAQKEASSKSVAAVAIPQVSYFQEKRTIAKWAERWDKPSVPTYCYLVSFGKVLGYYVCDGKPASTRSYIMPEESIHGGSSAGYYTQSEPDLDGCWGENNAGIRFFTAEGVAVEWAGDGASYLYSDAPINFGYAVPKLNVVKN